jgi:bifunctional non-homologous end joining protein LigD
MSQAAVQRAPARVDASVVTGGKPAPFPGFVEPCHPTLREEAPAGARWVADASERSLFAEHLEGEGAHIQERAGAWV